MSFTLSGTTLALVEAVPATYDQAGYEALTYVGGECALKTVPELGRTWATVDDAVVCKTTVGQKKGTATWNPITFQLNIEPSDPAQDIYRDLEEDRDGVGSFRMLLPNGDAYYWTAQVSQYNYTDGGEGDTINMATVTLLIQSDEITLVEAP